MLKELLKMNENINNITGKRLKELRESAGLTMQEEADVLNKTFNLQITRGMMSRWESGKAQPSNIFLSAYARYHNMDLNYIIGLTDVKKNLEEKYTLEEVSIENNINERESNLLEKFRALPEARKLKIEARIEAEYDIVMENEQESRQKA
ncbi:helix-turn-helix domain-containing protein [Megamonas funiformis]|nr:helix-turn-helix domain-containing protein [Megamonas funiformis]QIB59707.1 helix-turn-helix domain-containing protein [Megamonas funiformis]